MIAIKTPLALITSACVLAGCATGRLEAQWSDPQFTGRPLAGEKVLVVCQASEQTVVRICQDQLATQLRSMGVTPVVPESPVVGDSLATARSLGAQAVMQASLSPTVVVNSSGSSIGFGLGSGGYHSGFGFGMAVPIGGTTQVSATTYSSDTTLTNVASGHLMWSGKASTAEQDVAEQIASLAKITVESARKAGML
jgi:hypothetical protein